jgi:predicted amidophosphoribosyltransferase
MRMMLLVSRGLRAVDARNLGRLGRKSSNCCGCFEDGDATTLSCRNSGSPLREHIGSAEQCANADNCGRH